MAHGTYSCCLVFAFDQSKDCDCEALDPFEAALPEEDGKQNSWWKTSYSVLVLSTRTKLSTIATVPKTQSTPIPYSY